MAIAPLDLQVLYSQLENVSKSVAHRQQGQQLATAIQQETYAKQIAEKTATVQQLESGDDAIQRVKDETPSGGSANGGSKKKDDEQRENPESRELVAFQDPNLGKFIDISG